MMKMYFLLVAGIIAGGCLSGCSSSPQKMDMMSVMPLGLAGAAGAIGYNCTDDDDSKKQLIAAGAAAAGGYLIGEYLKGTVRNEKVDEFNAGYSLGTSNAAKTQYWIIQNRQKEDDYWKKNDSISYRYYSFPGAQYDSNGVKLVDHDVIIRAVE